MPKKPKDSTSIAASLPPVFRKPFGLLHQLRSLSRLTLVRTPDEMHVTTALHKALDPKFDATMWLWHPRVGTRHMRKKGPKSTPLNQFYADIFNAGVTDPEQRPEHASKSPVQTLATAMEEFLQKDPRDDQNFLIVVDPTFTPDVQRVIVDFANHSTFDDRYVALMVFVCPPGTEVPDRLKPFINVVEDDNPFEPEGVARHVQDIFGKLRVPENQKRIELFAELMTRHVTTTFEIDNLISSAVILLKERAPREGKKFTDWLDTPEFDKSLEEVIKARYGN